MMNDADLLAACPEFVSFDLLMKATPSTEGDDRIIYVEASREERDQQGEVVLQKALQDSADHFLKFGVVDLDHKSMPAVARQQGIDNPEEWAIGQPVEVKFGPGVTMVKARLYQGDTPLAHRANTVWDGLTKLNPPARYYASVGGAVLGREVKIDPRTKERVAVITKSRWNNLALSAQPVNQHLSTATTTPIGVFTKSLGGFVVKALEAGTATDVSTLTGGAALGKQSLDRKIHSYWDFREALSGAIRASRIKPRPGAMARFASSLGLDPDSASEFVERFLTDMQHRRTR